MKDWTRLTFADARVGNVIECDGVITEVRLTKRDKNGSLIIECRDGSFVGSPSKPLDIFR